MSNRLDKWRAGPFSAYPNFSSPYWRALPLRRMKNLLLGIFFVAAGVGFVVDLLQNDADYRPLGQGFFWPVMLGAGMAILFVARIKRPRLVLPGALAWLVLVKLVDRGPTAWSLPYVLQHRHALYAIGIGLSVGVGYRFLFSFLNTVVLESVRAHTELALAQGIQATLVPTISLQNETFEVFGKSLPSAQMGAT